MYIKKSVERRNPSTQDVYRKTPNPQRKKIITLKKSENVETDKVFHVTLHVYNVCNTNFFKLIKPFSQLSKLCAFRSLHRHHIKHSGTILYNCNVMWLPIFPLQLPNNSLTLRGITHTTPKRCKSALHNSVATLQ
jgi:hypothetical protein